MLPHSRAFKSKAPMLLNLLFAHARSGPATAPSLHHDVFWRECPALGLRRSALQGTSLPLLVNRQAQLGLANSAGWPQQLQEGCMQRAHGTLLCRAYHTKHAHLGPPLEQVEPVPGIKAQVPRPVTNIRQRSVGYLRESLLLSYTALFDNVIFTVCEWLRVDKVLKWLTPHLEDGYASLTGTFFASCITAQYIFS